jgi:hypothetical protein
MLSGRKKMLKWIKKHLDIHLVARYEDWLPWERLNWREIEILEIYFDSSFKSIITFRITVLNFGIEINYYTNHYYGYNSAKPKK